MRIAVGSGNPVKRDATANALPAATSVDAVPVDSGVSEQPWGEAETIEGAGNRARRALAAGDYDLGVGLEGGVARIELGFQDGDEGGDSDAGDAGDDAEPDEGLFLTMWAAATDGDRIEYGGGPRLRLPTTVADRLEAGEELGPVMDDLLDTSGVKHDQGAAGVLTGGIVDRESALRHALAGALGPFVTDYY